MKKLFIILLCIFLLVGCGKKETTDNKEENQVNDNTSTKTEATLICSMVSDDPIHFTTEMIYSFENDSLVTLGVRYTYDLSGYTEAQRKTFANSGLCATDAIKDTLGMEDCKEELVGTNYIVNGTASKLYETSKLATYSATKSSYVSSGWTCTEQ